MPNQLVNFVKHRPEGQRFWVVRASGGQYLPHFRQAKAAAIGHLNDVALPTGEVDGGIIVGLQKRLTNASPDRPAGTITSHVNQVDKLVNEMRLGDLMSLSIQTR